MRRHRSRGNACRADFVHTLRRGNAQATRHNDIITAKADVRLCSQFLCERLLRGPWHRTTGNEDLHDELH